MKLYSIRWLPKPGESVEVWTVEAPIIEVALLTASATLPRHVPFSDIDAVEIEKRVPKVWRFGE